MPAASPLVRLLYAQKWKHLEMSTKEEWWRWPFAEMAKLTYLISERITSTFTSEGNPLWLFAENGKNELDLMIREGKISEEGNHDITLKKEKRW